MTLNLSKRKNANAIFLRVYGITITFRRKSPRDKKRVINNILIWHLVDIIEKWDTFSKGQPVDIIEKWDTGGTHLGPKKVHFVEKLFFRLTCNLMKSFRSGTQNVSPLFPILTSNYSTAPTFMQFREYGLRS